MWTGARILINSRLARTSRRSETRSKRIEEPEWPNRNELLETWQLATWYLELAVLRLLGYEGEYLSRLRLGGWEFDTETVPWSTSSQK